MLQATAAEPASDGPDRFVAVGTFLGFHGPSFVPKTDGRDYRPSPLLESIGELKEEFTVFSGLDHRASNGHRNWRNFLTGSGTRRYSLDQMIADEVGAKTRLASLEITCGSAPGNAEISITREGTPLPMIGRPSVLYGKLFSSGSDRERMKYVLESNRSVLDLVMSEARSIERSISDADRDKLDEYFTSVRDVEKKVAKQRDWLDRPQKKIDYPLPEFDPVSPSLSLECETIMYDLIALALQSDTTRVVSFLVPGEGQVFTINGKTLSSGYHALSHHGNDPAKIAELNAIGTAHLMRFGAFIKKLGDTKDAHGRRLLDSTIALLGSGMGDTNTHSNQNLPIVVAGGGWKSHGSHVKTERTDSGPRLGSLFNSTLESLGLERGDFAGVSSTMNEVVL